MKTNAMVENDLYKIVACGVLPISKFNNPKLLQPQHLHLKNCKAKTKRLPCW